MDPAITTARARLFNATADPHTNMWIQYTRPLDDLRARIISELEPPDRFTYGAAWSAEERGALRNTRAHRSSSARSQFHTAVKEDMTPQNVRTAKTITMLRMRYHTLRSQYKLS